uniref:Uncharacterized protein n=1 Tax=Anguilla anguilla TaxID=7936 RepID=A0A0E9XJS1_ANGAN
MCTHIDMKTVFLIKQTVNYFQNIFVYSHIYSNLLRHENIYGVLEKIGGKIIL